MVDQQELMKRIMEIQKDPNLTDDEKAIKRQQLLSGKWMEEKAADKDGEASGSKPNGDVLDDETLQCTICHSLCVRPVTAPCQHNFCLKCFQDMVVKAKKTACPNCRLDFGRKFADNPRINTALTMAIRAFKQGRPAQGPGKPYVRVNNDDRPDEAFKTDRAVRNGLANAASGRIFVTVPNDWFGPIPAEHDPVNNKGVCVGDFWRDRLHCRQWGAHFPHVAGIAGQSNAGAQSVVLSGGYKDDRDEGEWFVYTGSGGRDLSGNKRTSNQQSHDQEFTAMNKALLTSCERGLPVRVVRSYKEKRSAYAPTTEQPVRYDGIYKIVRCWRSLGEDGKFLVCRYLFKRCDNEAAVWSSEEAGDEAWDVHRDDDVIPKDPELLKELEAAQKKKETVHKFKGKPNDQGFWGWIEKDQKWGWLKEQPPSQRTAGGGTKRGGTGKKRATEHERALREMACHICKETAKQPVSTPCGHNFCKPCLDTMFAGIADEVQGGGASGRSMRVRKVVKPCPKCKVDICDFLSTAQVNRDMETLIAKLQKEIKAVKEANNEDEDGEENEALEQVVEEEEEMVEDDDKPSGSVPAAPAPSAANGAPSPAVFMRNEDAQRASRHAAYVDQLVEEFPEFDRGLVAELLDQEDGDFLSIKTTLSRMSTRDKAAEKRKAKAAKDEAAGNGAGASSPAAAGGSKKKMKR